MQRFRCLLEANRQSLRVSRQLQRHGQTSNFSSFTRLPRKRILSSSRPSPLQSQISPAAFRPSIYQPSRRLISNITATPPNSDSPISPPPSDEFVPADSPFSIDPYDTSSVPTDTLFNVDPHPGYLKELGLDYGWGTTTLVQNALEYAYIYGGYSWGVTLVGVVLAFRLAMFKFAADASDMGARLRATRDVTVGVDARLKEAVYKGDMIGRMAAVQEKQAIYQAAGVKMSKIFVNILINVPVGFSVFRLMRGMAGLPVPGFENGGFAWIQDLSVPDPLYILPTVTAAMFYFTFRFAQQTGEGIQNTKSTMVVFGYVLPAIALVFGITFPGALQLTMLTTALTQFGQQYLFAQPAFRQLWGMHPLPEKKVVVPKVLNVKGRVIETGPAKPIGLVPRLKWHMKRVAKETQETSENLFPSTKKPEQKKKGSKRR